MHSALADKYVIFLSFGPLVDLGICLTICQV